MRFLRLLPKALAVIVVLAVLVIGAGLTPPAQSWIVRTWILEPALAGDPGVRVSFDSASALPWRVRVTGLRLQSEGIDLKFPRVEIRLPLGPAVWSHRLEITDLVAKDWTLDLAGANGRHAIDSASAANPTTGSETASRIALGGRFRGLLSRFRLPAGAQVRQLDLEGDLHVPSPISDTPNSVHLVLTGSGLAPRRSAAIILLATGALDHVPAPIAHALLLADSQSAPVSWPFGQLTVSGKSSVAIDESGFVKGVTFNGGALDRQPPRIHHFGIQLGIASVGTGGSETYTGNLSHAGRELVNVTATFHHAEQTFEGIWKCDLRKAELAAVWPNGRAFPRSSVGDGRFDCPVGLARLHVVGALKTDGIEIGASNLGLSGLRDAAVEAHFDVTRSGDSISLDRFEAVLGTAAESTGAPHPALVELRSIAPLRFDEDSRKATTADPDGAWLRCTFRKFPLSRLASASGGWIVDGEVSGALSVSMNDGAIGVRSGAPLSVRGISVRRNGRPWLRDIDAAIPVVADYDARKGWTVAATSVRTTSEARPLGRFEAKANLRRDDYGRIPVTGFWNIDLDTLAAQPFARRIPRLRGRSASGTFTAYIGSAADFMTTVEVKGHAASNHMTGKIDASVDDYRAAGIESSFTLTTGALSSDLAVNGNWTIGQSDQRIDLVAHSRKMALVHLRMLAGQVPELGAVLNRNADDPNRRPTARATRPFWGSLLGRVRFEFSQLAVGDRELGNVGGSIDFDHRHLRLRDAAALYIPFTVKKVGPEHLGDTPVEPRSVFSANGILSFNTGAGDPYAVNATFGIDKFDSTRLFSRRSAGGLPVIEGHLGMTDTLSASGATMGELVARRRERFELTGRSGILHLLDCNVAASMPENPTPVSDALANAGHAVEWLFGVKNDSEGQVRLDKKTEAILQFSYQTSAIPYDKMTVTATRMEDGRIRLTDLDVRSAEFHVTGFGEIAFVRGRPPLDRPVNLSLLLGVKGVAEKRLSIAGLVSPKKDRLGYTLLDRPLRFGGTVNRIDKLDWVELLANAALAGHRGG